MINYEQLRKLKQKFYFTVDDLAEALKIQRQSAWVLASRYTKEGVFLRLKNNFYVWEENWAKFSRDEFLKVSNYLQVPSYVSFLTALSMYNVTTQVQRNFFEGASLKRSAEFEADGAAFKFYKLQKQYYFDFIRKDSIFVATKEKAFIDSLYLYSFGKYALDLDALDMGKLNKARLCRILKKYPAKTRAIAKKICKNL